MRARVRAWLMAAVWLVISCEFCLAQTRWPPNSPETAEEYAERMKHPLTFPTDRLSVVAPPTQVPVATPLDIALTVAPGKIVGKMWVLQTGPDGVTVAQGNGPAKIVQENGLTKTVEIIPADLGTVTVQISALYADNAYARQTIKFDVVPTVKGLKSFTLGNGSPVGLVVDGPDGKDQEWLRPTLMYETLKYPIFASNARQVQLSVEQPLDDPVIRIDKTGLVHALRAGKAVIVGEFDGVTSRIPVVVYPKKDTP